MEPTEHEHEPDRRIISLADEDSARYWTQVLGVTRGELYEAIQRVGHQAWAVRKWLKEKDRT